MRAIYHKNLNDKNQVINDKEILHHLKNVLRLKENDSLLCLNGEGSGRKYLIISISKNQIEITSDTEVLSKEKKDINIAICVPKREALELCLKQAVELGVSKIYFIKSEYSQATKLSDDRMRKILVSALEQSNSYYLPEIVDIGLKEYLEQYSPSTLVFTSQSYEEKIHDPMKLNSILIGPEGGFSKEEDELFRLQKTSKLYINGPIMRTPTALSFALGFLYSLKRIDD